MILTTRAIALVLSLAFASGGAALSLVSLTTPADGVGSDRGLDTNGNGAFDWLVLEASVDLPTTDYWNVQAMLSSTSPPKGGVCGQAVPPPVPILETGLPYGSLLPPEYPIAWAGERYFFLAGAQTVRIAFRGTDIFRAGIDGPYLVRATLIGGDGIVYGRADGFAPVPWPGPPVMTWNYTTQAYAAADFEEPFRPAYFTGAHDDLGIHVDEDGAYDLFELRAAVHVNTAGIYYLNGMLLPRASDPNRYATVAYGYRDLTLEAGETNVALRFRGDQIRAAGVDGPWAFSLVLTGPNIYTWDGGNMTPQPALPGTAPYAGILPPTYPEVLCGETSAYSAVAFDDTIELARYTGVFAEATVDWDGDGLHDLLVVRAEVDVFLASAFEIRGALRVSDRSMDIATSWGQVQWPEGTAWAEFAFAGPDIRASGVEGPYEAFLSIIPLVWGIDPSTTYVTRAYKATDFDDRADGNRSYWIDSLSASVDPSRVLGVRVVVVRGNDMLTVVYEDTLTIELSDPAGVLVGSVVDRVVLTSGGSSWSMSATFGVLGSGTYTVTAILGPPSAPVDVRSTVVTV